MSSNRAPGKRLRVASLGECMIELTLGDAGSAPDPGGASSAATVGFAGDTLNTALYLRRCCEADIDVAYVTVIGRDALSDRMLAFFAGESLDVSHVKRHDTRSPGLYAIATDAAGERRFTYWRERSAARTLFSDADVASVLAGFDLVYLSGISLAVLDTRARERLLDWLPEFRDAGGRVAFDSNYRPRLWDSADVARETIEQVWRNCDIGLPSADDEIELFGDSSAFEVRERLSSWDVREGVVKNGAAGALVIDATGETPGSGEPAIAGTGVEFPAAPAVLDTTAAGDSFNGAYLAARLEGYGVTASARRGHACASVVIGHRGAIVPGRAFDVAAIRRS